MKTKEGLNQLKTEYGTLNNKLKELSEDELKAVVGRNHDGVSDFLSYDVGKWFCLNFDNTYIYRLRKCDAPTIVHDDKMYHA